MLTIVIGNKNRSSWSMRPWLALTKCGETFEEELIRLDEPTFLAWERGAIAENDPA